MYMFLQSKSVEENMNKQKLGPIRRSLKRTKYLHLMLVPGIIFYILFEYLPIYGIQIAFKDFNTYKGIWASDWVGFDNFIRFFNHPYFFRVIKNTLVLNFYDLLFGFPAPILLALFLNELRNLKYKKFVQTVSYLPHFISTVSIVSILFLILSPQGGMVNNIIEFFGGEPQYFMAKSRYFRFIFVSSEIWTGIGWGAIIYIAALSAVSQELYESASIDGASRIQKARHISIPAIQPTIVIMLILNISKMMNSHTQKLLLMQMPITYEVSDVIGTYVYRRGLVHAEYSFGTAVGLFNSVIALILVVAANYTARRFSESSLW